MDQSRPRAAVMFAAMGDAHLRLIAMFAPRRDASPGAARDGARRRAGVEERRLGHRVRIEAVAPPRPA
jgi:hypothetical protein